MVITVEIYDTAFEVEWQLKEKWVEVDGSTPQK
jgi:hypothetical protein